MFRAYLGPSSGGTTVCIQQLALIILFRWLSVVLFGLELYLLFSLDDCVLSWLDWNYTYYSLWMIVCCPGWIGTILIILFGWLCIVLVGLGLYLLFSLDDCVLSWLDWNYTYYSLWVTVYCPGWIGTILIILFRWLCVVLVGLGLYLLFAFDDCVLSWLDWNYTYYSF